LLKITPAGSFLKSTEILYGLNQIYQFLLRDPKQQIFDLFVSKDFVSFANFFIETLLISKLGFIEL